ncbi:MAG: hypothetical protein AAGG68_07635 [Bacteroidota bacterium]
MKKRISTQTVAGIIFLLAGILNLVNSIYSESKLLFQIAGSLFILAAVTYFYAATKKNDKGQEAQ